MTSFLVSILALLTFPSLFPQETRAGIRKAKHWFRAFFEKHCSPAHWERVKHEWDDVF